MSIQNNHSAAAVIAAVAAAAACGAMVAGPAAAAPAPTTVPLTAGPSASATPTDSTGPGGDCVDVFTLAVQGTGQSSPGASRTADSGFLAGVFSREATAATGTPGLGGGDYRPALRAGESLFSTLKAAQDAPASPTGAFGSGTGSSTTMGQVPVTTSREGVRTAHEYIPYESSAGGMAGIGHGSYVDSVEVGKKELERRAQEILHACPATKLALIGYSQGADVVDQTAELIGRGDSAIPAEAVAMVSVYGSPRRAEGMDIIPSTSGTPTSAESGGGSGSSTVDGLEKVTAVPPRGAGLLPAGDHVSGYGRLAGRVASFCAHGDVVCDTPPDSAMARVLARVASQTDISGGDPFRAIEQMGDALALTPMKAVSTGFNEDVRGTDLQTMQVHPSMSISQRIEQASARPAEAVTDTATDAESASESTSASASASSESSPTVRETAAGSARSAGGSAPGLSSGSSGSSDPATAIVGGLGGAAADVAGESLAAVGASDKAVSTAQQSITAVARMGLLGLSAVKAVARETFTPETISQVAAAGLADPAAGLAVLGSKVVASATKVVAPVGMKAAGAAFDIARSEVEDNAGLLQMATDITYWNHFVNHTSYDKAPVTESGASALDYTAGWITAAAADHHDVAAGQSQSTAVSSSARPEVSGSVRAAEKPVTSVTSEVSEPSEPSAVSGGRR